MWLLSTNFIIMIIIFGPSHLQGNPPLYYNLHVGTKEDGEVCSGDRNVS